MNLVVGADLSALTTNGVFCNNFDVGGDVKMIDGDGSMTFERVGPGSSVTVQGKSGSFDGAWRFVEKLFGVVRAALSFHVDQYMTSHCSLKVNIE